MGNYKYIIYRLLLGGLNNVTSKFAVMELNFAWYLMLRNTVSGLYMHGSSVKIKELKEYFQYDKTIKTHIWLLSFWRVIGVTSFYIVLQVLPVSFVSVMEASLSILFGVTISKLLLKERISTKGIIYLVAIITGMLLTCTISFNIKVPYYCWLFMLANGLGIAMNSYYAQKIKGAVNNTVQMFAMVETVIPVCLLVIILTPSYHRTFTELIAYFTLSFTAVFLLSALIALYGNFFTLKSIQAIGSTKTIVIQSCMPVVSVILSILIYKDPFTVNQVIGLVLVIFGIIRFNLTKLK